MLNQPTYTTLTTVRASALDETSLRASRHNVRQNLDRFNNLIDEPRKIGGLSRSHRSARIVAAVSAAHDNALQIAFKAGRSELQAERRRASR